MVSRAVKKVERVKVRIPCPLCGRRVFDWQGDPPADKFSEEVKCRRCGFVWVTSEHIRQHLTKNGSIARI